MLISSLLFPQNSSPHEKALISGIYPVSGPVLSGDTSLSFHSGYKRGTGSDIIIKRFEPVPFSISAALLLSAGTFMHIKASEYWWKKTDRFRLSNAAGTESIFAGAGHFYSANLNGHLFSGVYESSGMQALESTWFSSISSLIYSVYIETENGFHQGQGFSLSNTAGNILGTAFYIGQYYYPVLKSIQPRISYWPSEDFERDGKLITDDIYGQKLWLNIRVPEFMPDAMNSIWPDFLNAAAGISIIRHGNKKTVSTYLALDLDAEKIPLYGPFWQFVKNTLNYFHFPLPGIRISPETTAFIFCF